MFDSLTEKLSSALRNLRGVGKLSEENMAATLAEVRAALLSADVHFKVAREFTERVQAECAGQEVLKGVTPGQQIVRNNLGSLRIGSTVRMVQPASSTAAH